jgi:GH24 family phage-related lysozyme (muramidase)
MATKKKNRLQMFIERYGIGEKGPIQQFHETDPYGRYIAPGGGMVRGEPVTPEILEAKRRFHAKQKPTYKDTGNIVKIETLEDTTVPSERARPRPMTAGGMGGYSQGGLFERESPILYPGDEMTRTWEKAGSPGKRTTSWDRETPSVAPDVPTDLLDAALYESNKYFGTRSPGDEMTAAYEAEQLRRRRAEAPYDLVTAAVGRNPTVVGSGYPARDLSRDPYLGGAGAGGSELTRYAQRQAELNSASMDMPRGLFGTTYQTTTGTAPYSAERNWGQPYMPIGGGSQGEEIQAEMQRQAALESAGMDFEIPFRGGTYTTTTGADTQAPVTRYGQPEFIPDAAPLTEEQWKQKYGAGFGGGSATEIPTSRATPVDTWSDIIDPSTGKMEQDSKELDKNPNVIKVAQLSKTPLSFEEKFLVKHEGFRDTEYKDKRGPAIGIGQTGKYFTPNNIMAGFKQAISDKRKIAKDVFGKNYTNASDKIKGALLSLVYRGDVKKGYSWMDKYNKARQTKNKADMEKAYQEFWDNKEYKDELKNPTGVLVRIRENSK